MKLYVLQQDVTTATKKARAMSFDADVFNPLTFTEQIGSLKESFVNDKIIEMTQNEFMHYQSHTIGHVESVMGASALGPDIVCVVKIIDLAGPPSKKPGNVYGKIKNKPIPHWEDQNEQGRGQILTSLCIMMIDLELRLVLN